MVSTKGCWFHYDSFQKWPELPTFCVGRQSTESCCQVALPQQRNLSTIFQVSRPTYLYEDPLWYISTLLGYNLGGQKETLKQIQHYKTHSRQKKETKVEFMQRQEIVIHMDKETICLWGYFVLRNRKKRMEKSFRLAVIHWEMQTFSFIAASQQSVNCVSSLTKDG